MSNTPKKKQGMPLWTFFLFAFVMLLAAGGLVGYFWYQTTSDKKQVEREEQAQQVEEKRTELRENQVEIERKQELLDAEAAQAEARRVVEMNLRAEVLKQLRDATNSLEGLLVDVRSLNTDTAAMLTDEVGKKLAQHPELVSRARVFYDAKVTELPSADEVIAKLEAARRLEDQFGSNIDSPGTPSHTTLSSANGFMFWAESQQETVAKVRTELETLQREARIKHSEIPITDSSPTLQDGIDQLVQAEVKAAQEVLVEKTTEAKEISAKTEAEIAAAAILAEQDAKLQEIQRQLESMKKEQERKDAEHAQQLEELERENQRKIAMLEAESRRADVENQVAVNQTDIESQKIALRQKASTPDVKNKLAPFLTSGNWQPGRGFTIDSQPMSYSALQEAGALNRNMKGLDNLVDIAANPKNSPRPRWKQAYWKKVEAKRTQFSEAQALLIELGPTLVEMGMLAP